MGSLTLMEEAVARGLRRLLSGARGSCMTFKVKDVARAANISMHPVTLSVVRDILDEMVRKGLVGVWRAGRRRRYIVAEGSPLWREAKKMAGVVRVEGV